MNKISQCISAPALWNDYRKHFDTVITNEWYRLIFHLSSQFILATHSFFKQEDIDPVLMPITVTSISSPMGKGSDSIAVEIDLFGSKTYLADSMQFQLEYLLRLSKKGVYYLMPTFRGEDSSVRHLNQFFHSEVEIHGDLEKIIALAERYVVALTTAISENLGDELERAGIGTEHLTNVLLMKNGFPRITFQDVQSRFGNIPGFFNTLEDGIKIISAQGEREIIKMMGGICWLTYPPANSVPFYQARHTDNQYACSADLLCGIGEILGLGQRHRSHESTLDALKDNGVDPVKYEWYLYLKQTYPLVTSGFGLGMERYLLWILKHDDIRDIPLLQRLKNQYNEP